MHVRSTAKKSSMDVGDSVFLNFDLLEHFHLFLVSMSERPAKLYFLPRCLPLTSGFVSLWIGKVAKKWMEIFFRSENPDLLRIRKVPAVKLLHAQFFCFPRGFYFSPWCALVNWKVARKKTHKDGIFFEKFRSENPSFSAPKKGFIWGEVRFLGTLFFLFVDFISDILFHKIETKSLAQFSWWKWCSSLSKQ